MEKDTSMTQMAVQIAFYKTKKETRGIDVLKKLGKLKQNEIGEYESFTYGKSTYPIGSVIIKRSELDGYAVYIEKETYKRRYRA